MKFSINIPDVSEWHKWFAWYPAEVSGCKFVWLEYVERKMTIDASYISGVKVEYREIL